MLSVVSEIFTNSATRIRSQELKGSSFGGSSSNDDGVFHGFMVSEGLDQVGDCGSLLSDSDVDTEKLLLDLTGVEVLLLVDDGIDSDGSLTSLSVTNNKFSLSSTNGDQTINGLKTSLHGLVDGFSGDNTGSLNFDSLSSVSVDGTKTIDGLTIWKKESYEMGTMPL